MKTILLFSTFEHSIFLADRALIVSTPDVSSVRDADRVIGIIDAKSEKAKKHSARNRWLAGKRCRIAHQGK